MVNRKIEEITSKIILRSENTRNKYLNLIKNNFDNSSARKGLSCGNLAHGFAGCNTNEKKIISECEQPNIGIISAYNDMLSAHKPYEKYPDELREYAAELNLTVQVAGAVPAMCDGVTQGQPGMELSLFSRDIIALSTAIGLSHDMFDGVLNLGICDKIVPGLLIGNLSFGHNHSIFLPGGPMKTGISNERKAKIRQDFAEGKIGREELLKGESDSYHSPGTCTFYGTANSNQMLMEIMGLQLPGSSFVNPNTSMRKALNKEALKILNQNIKSKKFDRTIGKIIDEKSVVNGIVGLLATGGSTNHTIHLISIAKAAGIQITWDDFSELSECIPLICRVYPNGAADINHFHASGGMAYVIYTLIKNGLLHENVNTIIGSGLSKYTKEPKLINGEIRYKGGPKKSLNDYIIRSVKNPFNEKGGIKVLKGNIGSAIIKTSAVSEQFHVIKEKAIVFDSQNDLISAFEKNQLNKNFIAVLPFQGPKQKGMPELHKLIPTLTILQKKGFNVALITDGRMSGASGKIPAAIHVSPEAADNGLISKIRTGDLILIDAINGKVECLETEIQNRKSRLITNNNSTHGRSLFDKLRSMTTSSDKGASFI